jgi:hypothetical protein
LNHSLRSIDNSLLPVKTPKTYRLNHHILRPQKPPLEVIEKVKEVFPAFKVESTSLEVIENPFDRSADRTIIAVTQEGVKDLILEYRETTKSSNGKPTHGQKRGKITAYTPEARKRHILTLRNCANRLKSLVTLTYPEEFPTDCKVAMIHLDRFEKRLARRGYKFIWTKEFQERRAVHFHMGIDQIVDRKEIAQMWYECVGSQDERHLKAGTSVQWLVPDGDPRIEPDRRRVNEEKRRGNRNAKRNYIAHDEFIKYMITYLKKLTQKVVPSFIQNVGKFWDCSNALSCKNTMPVRQRIKMTYRQYMAKARLYRRWLQAQYRSWKIFKWKMRAKKTIVYNGARLLDELRLRYQPF